MHYTKAEMYDLSYEIIGSAISVHKEKWEKSPINFK